MNFCPTSDGNSNEEDINILTIVMLFDAEEVKELAVGFAAQWESTALLHPDMTATIMTWKVITRFTVNEQKNI